MSSCGTDPRHMPVSVEAHYHGGVDNTFETRHNVGFATFRREEKKLTELRTLLV